VEKPAKKKEEKEQPEKVKEMVVSDKGRPEKEPAGKKEKQDEPAAQPGEKAAAQKPEGAVTREAYENVKVTPVARRMMEEEGLSVEDIIRGLRKITAGDVGRVLEQRSEAVAGPTDGQPGREVARSKISQLRKKISSRLVAVKNETAMLTTFNEADMSRVMQLRKKYQQGFQEKHGIKLGFMSFFTRAVTLALRQYPSVNSYLEEGEIITPAYCDIGIAVQTDKGLMVPVLRNAESLTLAEIENQIAELAGKARKARLSIDEMSGGTFTISNGGIYGSMLSTPILNPPQSGILGIHNIVDRPVAIDGRVEVRPVMYLALSYDHRVIDGRDSVSFLRTVKEYIEDPVRMVFGERSPENELLDI
ncbi:MAG: dihydrolipoyllysine-residue succinyltransferase, partial [Bacteroidetes bacterium]